MTYSQVPLAGAVALLLCSCHSAPVRLPAPIEPRAAMEVPRAIAPVALPRVVEWQGDASASYERAEAAEARAERARRAALEEEARRVAQQRAALARRDRSAADRDFRDLVAVKSERGTVITLNDVLFDAGSATLRPGGQRLVVRLADYLRLYPERTIAIEGFSDSVGDDLQGLELSERRAVSVRLALLDAGVVDGSRVFVRGYGKAFPLGSNETRQGRQRNRRVEVVISDERGSIAPRVATVAGR